MKHTKGPWKVHHHSHINHEQWLSVLNGAFDITHNGARNPAVIACSKYSAMSDEENLANAVLMAASPELLTDCDSMHAVLMDLLQSDMHQQVCVSLAENGVELSEVYRTILKAKGE